MAHFSRNCTNYDSLSPTSSQLIHDAPPEFWYLMPLSAVFLVLGTVLWAGAVLKHVQVVGERPSLFLQNTLFMLSVYWVFETCSFLGMIFIRGSQFLHCIANTIEAVCCYAFFQNMINYLELTGYQWGGAQLMRLRRPPCFCWCGFLPDMSNNKTNLKRLRLLIVQLMVTQTVVEVYNVLSFEDCLYDAQSTVSRCLDGVVTVSFLFGIWPIVIVLKTEYLRLRKYKVVLKFLIFKAIIGSSKFLGRILDLLAKRNVIGSSHVLTARLRALFFTNFVTIIIGVFLQLAANRLYSTMIYTDEQRIKELAFSDEEGDEGEQNELELNYDSDNDNELIINHTIN